MQDLSTVKHPSWCPPCYRGLGITKGGTMFAYLIISYNKILEKYNDASANIYFIPSFKPFFGPCTTLKTELFRPGGIVKTGINCFKVIPVRKKPDKNIVDKAIKGRLIQKNIHKNS